MHPDPEPTTTPNNRPNRWWLVAVIVPAVFAVMVGIIVATGRIPGRVEYDQLLYHEPAIRIFAKQWPNVDVRDYLSATTPGYHLLLAAFAVYINESIQALQLVGSLFTVLLFLVLGLELARKTRPAHVIALSLPILACTYVFTAGAWLLPDNAGWLGVLLVMVLALRQPRSAREAVVYVLVAGIAVACTTLFRQIHVWTAGMVIASAWISRERDEKTPTIPLLFENMHQRAPWLALGLIAAVPAFAIVIAFTKLWDGRLVPPAFKDQYSGSNIAATPFILSLLGIFSLFYIATLGRSILALARKHHDWFVLALVVSFLAAVIPPTTFAYDSGRRTGLWNLANKLSWMDIFGHTSPLMFALTMWGGMCAAGWMVFLSARDRVVLICGLAGFCMAHSLSPEVWQRYVEPFVLLWLALAASRSSGNNTSPTNAPMRQLEIVGPVFLAAILGAQTLLGMRSLRPMSEGAPAVETPDKAHKREAPVYRYWNPRGRDQPPHSMRELYLQASNAAPGATDNVRTVWESPRLARTDAHWPPIMPFTIGYPPSTNQLPPSTTQGRS